MLLINPDKIVSDHPAVMYCEARPMLCYDRGEQYVQLHDGDVFALKQKGKDYHNEHTVCTVMGYAVRHCDCPIKALEEAKANGHELVSSFGNGASLTNSKREKKTVGVIFLGQVVKIEGHLYEVVAAPNNNVAFKLVDEEKKAQELADAQARIDVINDILSMETDPATRAQYKQEHYALKEFIRNNS